MQLTLEERKKSGEIFFLPVHEKNVNLYKKILEVTLPVVYDDKFLKSCATEWSEFCKILHFKDIPVGVIGGRIEVEGGVKRLYISVISVLAAYRGRGLGQALLEEELSLVASKHPEVVEAYVHVHTPNSEACKFYEAAGFTKDAAVLEGYYTYNREVAPPKDAFVYRKALSVRS